MVHVGVQKEPMITSSKPKCLTQKNSLKSKNYSIFSYDISEEIFSFEPFVKIENHIPCESSDVSFVHYCSQSIKKVFNDLDRLDIE